MDKDKKEIKAVVIAENFTKNLHPLNQTESDLLIPVCTIPYIEYLIEFLLGNNVSQIIFVVNRTADSLTEYIKNNFRDLTKKNSKLFLVINKDINSVGDGLREIFKENLISNDFVLVRGLTITNFNLEKAYEKHCQTKIKDKNASVTSIFKTFKNSFDNQCQYDKALIVINDNERILQYETINPHTKKLKLNENVNFKSGIYKVMSNIYDSFIDICSVEVLSHFNDNFDYHDIRDDLYRNYLVSEMYLDTFYYFCIEENKYCNTIKNLDSYLKVNYEIINRWAHPEYSLENITISQKLGIKYIYTHNNVYLGISKQSNSFNSTLILARMSTIADHRASAQAYQGEGQIQVVADYSTKLARSVVSIGTVLSENSDVTNSIISKRCSIGKNTVIKYSVILDDVEIGDNIIIINSIIGNSTKVRTGVKLVQDSYFGSFLDISDSNPRLNGLLQHTKEIKDFRIFSQEEDFNLTEGNYDEGLLVGDEEDEKEKSIKLYTVINHKDYYDDMCFDDKRMHNTRRNFDLPEENEGEDFTDSESEQDEDDDDYYEKPVKEIFEKRAELIPTIEELVILRKAYWNNTNSESRFFLFRFKALYDLDPRRFFFSN